MTECKGEVFSQVFAISTSPQVCRACANTPAFSDNVVRWIERSETSYWLLVNGRRAIDSAMPTHHQ